MSLDIWPIHSEIVGSKSTRCIGPQVFLCCLSRVDALWWPDTPHTSISKKMSYCICQRFILSELFLRGSMSDGKMHENRRSNVFITETKMSRFYTFLEICNKLHILTWCSNWLWAGWSGFDIWQGKKLCFSWLCPDQLWKTLSLLSNRYWALCPGGKVAEEWK